MAAAGADGLFRCGAYEGCISGSDVGKERRPYHRNCGCALHNRSENKKYRQQQQQCTHEGQKSKSVSYPLRRAWSRRELGFGGGEWFLLFRAFLAFYVTGRGEAAAASEASSVGFGGIGGVVRSVECI